jgi:hypothetical protein
MTVATAHSLPPMALASSATDCAASSVAVGDDDVRAALGGEQSDLAADAAASADDEHDAAAELLFRRLAADLGLFERPVLDAEGLAGRQRDVVLVTVNSLGGSSGTGLRDRRCRGRRRRGSRRPA